MMGARRFAGSIMLAALLVLPGCGIRQHADEALCVAILDRIIDFELEAMGYHDPVLADMKRRQLRETLKQTLTQCIGMQVPRRARSCVVRASSINELTHECLSFH